MRKLRNVVVVVFTLPLNLKCDVIFLLLISALCSWLHFTAVRVYLDLVPSCGNSLQEYNFQTRFLCLSGETILFFLVKMYPFTKRSGPVVFSCFNDSEPFLDAALLFDH